MALFADKSLLKKHEGIKLFTHRYLQERVINKVKQ